MYTYKNSELNIILRQYVKHLKWLQAIEFETSDKSSKKKKKHNINVIFKALIS